MCTVGTGEERGEGGGTLKVLVLDKEVVEGDRAQFGAGDALYVPSEMSYLGADGRENA